MTSARRLPGAFWRLFRGRARREDGQALLMVVGGLVALCAMAGFVIDIGRVYVAQRDLQTAVDAAALAAAQDMPDPNNAQTSANMYSMAPNGTAGCNLTYTGNCLNVNPLNATATVPIVKTLCVKTFPNTTPPASTNLPCQIYPGSPNSSGYSCNGNVNQGSPDATGCNAVQVSESAKVNTTFLNVVGVGSLFSAITSKTTVLMRGGTPHPLDVEIVLDVSSSMNQPCTDQGGTAYRVAGGNGTSSKLDCAKEGIRTLIGSLWPCDPSLGACPTPNTSPVDKVGLEIFPGVTSGVFTSEFDCSWTLTFGQEGYTNSSGYDVVPLSADYRTADSTALPQGNLVGTSPLVEATSWSSCNQPSFPAGNDPAASGGTPGNQSKYGAEAPTCSSNCTFFADAMGNAAINICNDTYGNPSCSGTKTRKAQGVIILLSDGDANIQGPNACQQAVQLSQAVAAAPYSDWVFAIGYDTPATGCSTDTNANEVQKITFTGTTSGTFTLAFNGATSGPITYTAGLTAAAIKTALTSAPVSIPAGNITVAGPNGGPFTVTFGGTMANQSEPAIVADGTNLVPSNTVAVAITTQGASSSGLNPYTTMSEIASDPAKFYCLHPPTIGGVQQTCNGASAANLNQIFKDVGQDITGTRVIENP